MCRLQTQSPLFFFVFSSFFCFMLKNQGLIHHHLRDAASGFTCPRTHSDFTQPSLNSWNRPDELQWGEFDFVGKNVAVGDEKKNRSWVVGGATERQSGTTNLWREHSMFCFISQVEREILRRDTDKEKRRERSPRIHCGWLWEDSTQRKRQREVTKEKSRRKEGRRAAIWLEICFVSHLLLYTSFCFSPGWGASELLGTPGRRLFRSHTRSKCREILRAAHVRSLDPKKK